MPSRNQQKDYCSNSYYHIYNRGVGKMDIFRAEQDYKVFLYYLRVILSPVGALEREYSELENSGAHELKLLRFSRAIHQSHRYQLQDEIELLSYCLMPNHFHLLVYQKNERAIEQLMRRLGVGYSRFFTQKYDHVGSVFQGRYNASHLYFEPDLQVLVSAKYIENNPSNFKNKNGSRFYPYSSLRFYKNKIDDQNYYAPAWINIKQLNNIFNRIKSKPNGVYEEQIANYSDLVDFMCSGDKINLADIRMEHLARL